MSDINRVNQIGRAVSDPILKKTSVGTSVASFSIAVKRTYQTNGEKKENVSFFNCVAWAGAGEYIAQHLHKGKRIAIEGYLQQRSWENSGGKKQSTVEIVVENFNIIDYIKDNQGDITQKVQDEFGGESEDIPF